MECPHVLCLPPQGRCSAATGFRRDQPSLSMILRHTRVKSCSATRAVSVPGRGTLPLIHRRESHATSDLVKAPRSRDRLQKPEQKRTPRKRIHPTPSPDLYLIPRGTEGPCLFPRGFFSGSVGPPLSCRRCCYSAFTPATFPWRTALDDDGSGLVGTALEWHVPPQDTWVACSQWMTHVGVQKPHPLAFRWDRLCGAVYHPELPWGSGWD